jgi:ubiquinone/menaquinone biosynthesis C-methylase UbiE
MVKPLFYMKTILRFVFKLLYHQFAFSYDLVAATVSGGQWNNWVESILPFIDGKHILEIGFGPGHLQRLLLNRDLIVIGIDESAPMTRLAQRNTGNKANLTRGFAQQLPFHDAAFDSVIATFPAEYITDLRTLSEVKRCLSDGGRFIVLPVALPKIRIFSWLFKFTGQAPSDSLELIQKKLKEPFVKSGFEVEAHVMEKKSGTLIVISATK